jgi:ribosomal protein L3
MAGHFGQVTKTITNLKVLSIDAKKNLLQIAGTVPGSRHTLLKISKTKKGTKLMASKHADN